MLLHAQPLHALYQIADGTVGTRQTLRLMARLVREYRTDPAIREKAAYLVQFLPGQQFTEEVRTLFTWVRDNIRYLGDVQNVETIQSPDVTLARRHGDCDDQATLLAAMLESIGHKTRFVAVGFSRPGEFDHVFTETRIGNDWVALETTIAVPMGWSAIDAERPLALMRETI